jgi:5-carboxymethyl-2-hydroxymuconate isomerase
MPHLAIEYSANLDERLSLKSFVQTLRDTMVDTGLFEVGAIRVRAIRCDAYAIADVLPQNAFIDMSVRLGAGRSDADKRRLGQEIFKTSTEYLSELLETGHFALSLEIREIDPRLSWKKNSIHPRLRVISSRP